MDSKTLYAALNLGDAIDLDLGASPDKAILAPLVALAQREAKEATLSLLSADPEDAKAIREHQFMASRMAWFVHWIREKRQESREAWQQLAPEQQIELRRIIEGRNTEEPDDA